MAWSTTWEICRAACRTTCGWVQRWWRWIVIASAVGGAFILGVLTRRKPQLSPSFSDIDDTKSHLEFNATEQILRIEQAAAEREKEVVDAASQERVRQVQQIADQTEQLGGDLGKTNQYLLQVGEDMRK